MKLLPGLVWMVVKGDLKGAKSVFKEFANDLLDKTIPDDIRKCVVPDLDIVTEYGDWEKFPDPGDLVRRLKVSGERRLTGRSHGDTDLVMRHGHSV